MTETIRILAGEDAVNLWQQGRDSWNAWVKANPICIVSFDDVDFGSIDDSGIISFSGFRFPDGYVSFDNSKFGNGDVSFMYAQFGKGDVSFYDSRFGEGDVSFYEAQFGEGNVNFDYAQFGKGNVDFREAQFGEGEVDFNNALFGKGDVDFYNAQFGEGDVNFMNAQFGEGEVRFHYSQFGEGDVSFLNTWFGKGKVNFYNAQFGKGNVGFREVQFGEGKVDFMYTQFGEGNVNFLNTQFGEGNVTFELSKCLGNMLFKDTSFGAGHYNFEYAEFGGNLMFTQMKDSTKIKSLSFRYATFNKALAIDTKEGFKCVVDLVSTNLSCHLDMHNFKCIFQQDEGYPMIVTTDKDDIGRLQRLKELSENNRAHEQAIDYKIQEMQARRIHEHDNILKLFLEYLFWAFSNYGRSILRPFGWLLGSTLMMAFLAAGCKLEDTLGQALECTLAQGLPLLANSKALINSHACMDFTWPIFVPSLYSIFCLVLIFLIGLGLRHRFRL